jgi:acyl dehydratase
MPGLWYEEFIEGMEIEHPLGRTLTEADNVFFSTLTLNTQPLHLDAEFSKNSPFGQRLVNSMLTLSCLAGMTVNETTLGTTMGNLGFEQIMFPNPVFHGDTIRITTEVVEKRESKSRPEAGLVKFRHVARNQRGEVVCDCRRTALMLKRPTAEEAQP